MLNLTAQCEGYYKIEATDSVTGSTRTVSDWFPNLITNVGLEKMGTGGVLMNCYVGSGNAAPTVDDSQLQSFVASTSTVTATSDSAQSTMPYYGSRKMTFRFNVGAAAGNLSEVGIGWVTNVSGVITNWCFSRALILDANGDPTTISILPTEFLDITYELRCYPPMDDAYFTVNLAGVDYNVTLRASNVTSNIWSPNLTDAVNLWSGTTSSVAYSAGIGSITSSPSGSTASATPVNLAYEANSLTKKGYTVFGLDQANYSGGIQSFKFTTWYKLGEYQMEFSPSIPKDNTRTWRIDVGISWARKVI